MFRRHKYARPDHTKHGGANENFRIYLDEIIREFVSDPERTQHDFPADYSKAMRAYIHDKCQKLGIKSKSNGKEPNRILSILKKGIANTAEEVPLHLASETHQLLSSVQSMKAKRHVDYKRIKVHCDSISRIHQTSTTCVPPVHNSPFTEFRHSLPIYRKRRYLLESIRNNQIVIISAETGSGKTTQIPQYIIEDALEKKQEVRVICTQPRRLSTVAVAERVAAERGEKVGNTIGYQIKLEQKLGVETAVIYCTNGILLRTLMSGEDCLQRVTHIVVDEIHERDKFTDFLMIILRENIKKHPHLRVILMSATMDMDRFVEYFDNKAFIITVEGRAFTCCSWFLEDVLRYINYENGRMRELRELRERNGAPGRAVTKAKPKAAYAELEDECKMEINEILARCFDKGLRADFDELMQIYLNENVNPNYQDWYGKTALMAASKHGNFQVIEQLLNMDADMFLSSAEGITASGWAQQANNMDVVNMLALYQQSNPGQETISSESGILADYDRTVNDEYIDYELILELIVYIHFQIDKMGSILVFLPGYEDILACHDRISASCMSPSDYRTFMLHGSMQVQHQHDVFEKYNGKQKIILATNIAETSITIDDIRYVVDCGKAKIKTYDARTGISSLKSEWISMANAKQRAGRAGRTQNGYCFHLYSTARYESFYVNPIPEILRTPLYELCLQTKLLAPAAMSISEFLNLAIDPPEKIAVQEAITTLQCLGALDEFETLTELGEHLVQFSIEPRLGKILIYGVILKCIDPVLTIVASMAQKDPFILPSQLHLKQQAVERRKSMADDSLSDHMILIRAFQKWQDHKVQNRGYQFCNQYFISLAVMELIMLTRSQLLSQLRAMGFVQAAKESINDLNIHSNDWAIIKGCLAAGLYPNTAIYNNRSLHTKIDSVFISGQSCLKGSIFDGRGSSYIKKAWLFFDEVSKPRMRTTIKSGTVISPITVALLCGQNTQVEDQCLLLDNSYAFIVDNPRVITLRNNVHNIIYKKISAPHIKLAPEELETMRTLARVICSEEDSFGFQAPDGIGKRPKIIDVSIKTRSNSQQFQRNFGNRGNFYETNQQQRGNGQDSFKNDGRRGGDRETSKIFPLDAIYFLIQPWEERNITFGMREKMWSFPPSTSNTLFGYINEGKTVFLIFHARKSPEFYGVARLLDSNHFSPNSPSNVEWITINRMPVFRARSFVHEKVHFQEDLYELGGIIGQRLCMSIYDYIPAQNRYFANHGPRTIVGNPARAGPSRRYN